MASSSLPCCEFACILSPADQDLVLNSGLFLEWIALVQSRKLSVSHILFQSVDFVGQNQNRRPLFIKLFATAFDEQNRPLPGICVLRGHAVAVLPILRTNDKEFVVLVNQSRLPAALPNCLEIPAGMCDGAKDLHDVAVRELYEETGIICEASELLDLLPGVDWIDASPGLLDEGVRIFKLIKQVSPAEIDEISRRSCGKEDEKEYIELQLMDPREALFACKDSKTLLALSCYLLSQKGGL